MAARDNAVSSPLAYVFPAVRGVQANREYFVSTCPMRLIPRIFLFNEQELVPELRAQRVLNKSRIPEITRYIVQNRDTYTFSAITASIDGEARFHPFGNDGESRRIGTLHIPLAARVVINDGQHRRAAIEQAIRENPEIADESIAVVFFLDRGLARSQQMFADLNRHAIRPSTSLGVLYDYRDEGARLTKLALLKLPLFRDLTEMERSSLSARSRKLFTLSALYCANGALLTRMEGKSVKERQILAAAFWEEIARHFPEWQEVHARRMQAAEVRRDRLHSHGIVLQALGRVGNTLLRERPSDWRNALENLCEIDWSRSNAKMWEGRAMVGGKVSKATTNVVLTTNAIKACLGLLLTPDEQRIEEAFWRGGHATT